MENIVVPVYSEISVNNVTEIVAILDRNFNAAYENVNLSNYFVNSTISSVRISIKNQNVSWMDPGFIKIIPLYSVIFLLAVIGNSLVILTLVQNKRMRTITNLFLLNLAVSDLFLGVFCMPFTLVGTILRDFVFGEIMCKLLPYLQATSVAVSAWTLVAISVERYYAICHPLRSRRWQTLKHAYKSIALIWITSLVFMLPIAILSKLIPTQQGHHKCREVWPVIPIQYEKVFNLFLDMILLVLPLFVLGATYFLITKTLWKGMQNEREFKKELSKQNSTKNSLEVYVNNEGTTRSRCQSYKRSKTNGSSEEKGFHQLRDWSRESVIVRNDSVKRNVPSLRRSNAEKSLTSKKRVIKMLFVVVLEFFICWTPLYVVNTIALFDKKLVYKNLGYTAISFFQLLAYTSSCCNPITYCFMNCGFRKSFLNLFRCFRKFREPRRKLSLGCPAASIAEGALLSNSRKSSTKRKNKTTRFMPDCREDSDQEGLSRQPSFHTYSYHTNYNQHDLDDSVMDEIENGEKIQHVI